MWGSGVRVVVGQERVDLSDGLDDVAQPVGEVGVDLLVLLEPEAVLVAAQVGGPRLPGTPRPEVPVGLDAADGRRGGPGAGGELLRGAAPLRGRVEGCGRSDDAAEEPEDGADHRVAAFLGTAFDVFSLPR